MKTVDEWAVEIHRDVMKYGSTLEKVRAIRQEFIDELRKLRPAIVEPVHTSAGDYVENRRWHEHLDELERAE